jgi:alcohol dehydrogenase class IV
MSGFFLAPRIGWGPGAIEQLSGLGARSAMVVVDPGVARRHGERRIVEELAKSETAVEVVVAAPEPDRWSEVRALTDRIERSGADWVVAVGGGRTLDSAKAARFGAELSGVDLATITPALAAPEPPRRRLVALPTTSGSGAEATWTADLTAEDGAPLEVAHRALMPDWALLDPALAEGLPVDRIVDGGFEALALATEAYLSAWSNPLTDALAASAASTVIERLPHAVRWSEDPDAREALHYAATAAGLASSNAQRGAAHALARALVAPTGLPYARLIGIALPFVLDFDRNGARDRLERLASLTRVRDDTADVPLAERVRRLADLVRMPATVDAAGGNVAAALAGLPGVLAAARRSPGVLSNPRVPTDDELRTLATQMLGSPSGTPS